MAAWTWNPLSNLELGTVSPKGRSWEAGRHRHYGAHLASKPIGETITCAATFLNNVTLVS